MPFNDSMAHRAVPSEIESYAGWKREPDAFLKAPVDCRFQNPHDAAKGGYELHNWERRQGWAYHAELRSMAAKNAVGMRW